MPSNNTRGSGGWLSAALTIGAVCATVGAVAIVAALVWWVYSLPPATTPEPAVAPAPVREPRVAAAGPGRAMRQPALPGADARARAAAEIPRPPAVAPPTPTVPPVAEGNSDLEKNRAIGQGLMHLGDVPGAAQRFGVPP